MPALDLVASLALCYGAAVSSRLNVKLAAVARTHYFYLFLKTHLLVQDEVTHVIVDNGDLRRLPGKK